MEAVAGGLDDQKEATADPEAEVRRWTLELALAEKREKDWRKNGRTIFDRYRGAARKRNSFNILWANTEVLRPALYNSTPKPDVRRRFRDSDPLGKAASEVLERSLTFAVDDADFDDAIKFDVLDMILPGRGVSRVRYIPSISQGEPPAQESTPAGAPAPKAEPPAVATAEPEEGSEELEYEQAGIEHVNWEDYRQGPGRIWPEVQWVAYRHQLKKDDVADKFGDDVANAIVFSQAPEVESRGRNDYSDIQGSFRTAEFWEIWDKAGRKVLFIQQSYKSGPLYPVDTPNGEPPLKLKGFFPQPAPLRAIEDSSSLLPTPLYDEYREQAEELDRLSQRINKLISGLKLRGVYDSTLSELSELMAGDDNKMVAVENAAKWMANGGFDKAIAWMPVDMAAKVLFELYKARDQAKAVVYEITGISDIIRGATQASETLGAQQLKAKFASVRIQRMQREVQRYIRDLIRIMGEVIGEQFQVETLAQMTGLNFPMAAQKTQAGALMQRLQAMQQTGQPPQVDPRQVQAAQAMLQMPTWEDIKGVLSSDISRQYRVDIETDSTVAETLSQDMTGLQEVLGGLTQFWQGVGPAVQAGAISMDAVKAISLQITRRARLGLEVEDALEQGMQQPQPQNNPQAAAEQQKMALAQQAQQHDALLAQRQQAHDQQQLAHEQQIAQREQAQAEAEARFKAQLEQQRVAYEARLTQQGTAQESADFRYKVDADNKRAIEVAEINKSATLARQQVETANAAEQDTNAALADDGTGAEQAAATTKKRAAPIDRIAEMHAQSLQAHQEAAQAHHQTARVMRDGMATLAQAAHALAAPRKLVRDDKGRPVGSRLLTQ